METDILDASHPAALRHAVDVLEHSGLVAFPTDTVYGLAASLLDDESIRRLYVVKGRNSTKAIAVLLSKIDELDHVAHDLTPAVRRLAEAFWPGPLTLVVAKNPVLPKSISSLPTVGVRIPGHPVALALLRLTGPLAVTSANLSGHPNANTALEVLTQLRGRIHLILDGGPTPGNIPSTVVDATKPEPVILRPGPITMPDILAVWNTSQ